MTAQEAPGGAAARRPRTSTAPEDLPSSRPRLPGSTDPLTLPLRCAHAAPEGDLAAAAAAVLRANDVDGHFTKASPALYPHQWSWDSAFIAVGWAHLDPDRALRELEHLFAAQWRNGKVPHIVFNPAGHADYFPGPEVWGSADSPDAPTVPTSGLIQPAVHAIALLRIWQIARRRGDSSRLRPRLADLYGPLLRWHRYLHEVRDADGLVIIYHPWESGLDNSPRWDGPITAVELGEVPPYRRVDLDHVTDPSQRPSDTDYDRYLWLVELMRRVGYDEAALRRRHPFAVADVFSTAVLVAADDALFDLARLVGAPEADLHTILAWRDRSVEALKQRWDPRWRGCTDLDLRRRTPIRSRTVAALAPLIAGHAHGAWLSVLLAELAGPHFAGHPGLRWPLPPSTSPEDAAFSPRSYWRGPVWPVINWLLWWATRRAGERRVATGLRHHGLAQIATTGFAEYVEPFTGEPLGSPLQSWTAAVALDWLANGDGDPRPH